jgi:TonB-linked SusC/RagA family outer membrane protein
MRIFLLLILFFGSCCAFAQSHVIAGKITNPKGEPVSFATIRVQGSKVSVAADADGSFKINASVGQTLVITAAGYKKTEVPVRGESVSMILNYNDESLSEVVVTALGQSQSKAKLGYSTSTFSTAAINKNAPVGMLDGLQGKVAGAEISNTGGPGAATKVILRGYGVFSGGSNQPLYVIDGVPLSDAQYQSNDNLIFGTNPLLYGNNPFTNIQNYGNGMNDVNPNDIESITILKGTAASSLYGGLAKNGAIMITTKKGRAGKLKLEYSGSVNFSKVGKLPDYETEFGQGWGGVFVLDENGSWGPRLDGKPRLWGSVVDNSQLIKPFSFQKNGLRDFYETGRELNNTVSLSGGNEISRFYFSYGNVSSDGVIPTQADLLTRNSFSLRSNSTFNRVTVNASFNYVNRKLNTPSSGQNGNDGGGLFNSLLQIPVDLPIKDFSAYKNKFFNTDNYFTPYAENPYFTVNEDGSTQISDRFFGNIDLGYKFTHYLSAQLRIGGDFTNARTKAWKQLAYASPGSWDAGANPEGQSKTPDVGSVFQGSDYFGIINSDFLLKYSNDLSKDFSLEAIAGGNYYQSESRSEGTAITNLVVPGFYNLSNTSLPPTTTDGIAMRRRIGVYGQATLAYKNQLYLTGNIRNDWSSTLPIQKNSIFYPGANLSWLASENFSAKNLVSYLKIRLAYGQTGSDPAPYLVYPTLGPGQVQLTFGTLNAPFNGVSAFGLPNTITNPVLKPILTNELELGTEIKFFNDRIGIDATVYDKQDKGQVLPISIPSTTGYNFLVENLGLVSNKGIELTINLVPVRTQSFNWSMNYTYARNWNNVDELTGSTQNPLLFGLGGGPEIHAVVGKTVASIYAPVAQKTPSGQIVVDPSTGFPAANTTQLDKYGTTYGYYGSGLYNFTMGLGNSFTYKSFSLSFSLDFRYGGVMFSQTANLALFVGNSVVTTYNDRKPFIVPNSVVASQDGLGNKTYVENKTYIGASGNGQSDDYYGYYNTSINHGTAWGMDIIDRSFLKLRDVNLSYELPAKWAKKVSATSIAVAIYGRNFLLWTPRSNVFVDPEATNLGNDLIGQLGEYATQPLTRSYGGSLKITF